MKKLGTIFISTISLFTTLAAAQDESEFSKQCKAALRKACKAESWISYKTVGGELLPQSAPDYMSRAVDIACEGQLRSALLTGYPRDQLGFNNFIGQNLDFIARVANRAAEIQQNCAIAEIQATLLQKQIAIAQENQTILRGDIQAILTKLVPGATVTITVPEPEPAASAPKAMNR